MRKYMYSTINPIMIHLSENVSLKVVIDLSGGPSKKQHMCYEPCRQSEMKVKPFLDTLIGEKHLSDPISRET